MTPEGRNTKNKLKLNLKLLFIIRTELHIQKCCLNKKKWFCTKGRQISFT